MKNRFVLAAAIILVGPVALVVGCSTSSVHPPTFGDCDIPGACGDVPPRGDASRDSGSDAGKVVADAKAASDGGVPTISDASREGG